MTPCLMWAASWRSAVPRWIVMGDLVLVAGLVIHVASVVRATVNPLLDQFTRFVGVVLHFLTGGCNG